MAIYTNFSFRTQQSLKTSFPVTPLIKLFLAVISLKLGGLQLTKNYFSRKNDSKVSGMKIKLCHLSIDDLQPENDDDRPLTICLLFQCRITVT